MAEENTEQEVKKSRALLFIIIGVAVLLILAGVALFVFLSSGDKRSQVSASGAQQMDASSYATKDANLLNVGPLYQIESPFIVNLITQSGRRYLKTSITLELSNAKLQQEIDQKVSVMRDIIIDVLSSKSIEEIVTTKGKEKIKSEILQRINQILVDGTVKSVFFTEFVVQ